MEEGSPQWWQMVEDITAQMEAEGCTCCWQAEWEQTDPERCHIQVVHHTRCRVSMSAAACWN